MTPSINSAAWIGVDLDGTLAEYHGWTAPDHIGAPIMPMVNRVRAWLAEGNNVRILTARGSIDEADREVAYPAIERWCETYIGQPLPITCAKDLAMIALWDDRAVQVVKNQGEPVLSLNELAKAAVATSRANGWQTVTPECWANSPHHVPAALALIHSEVSEALEDFRKDGRAHFPEELADVVIRVLDLAGGLEIDLDAAVAAKMAKNRLRSYRHGGKRV